MNVDATVSSSVSDPGFAQNGLINLNNLDLSHITGSFFANADSSIQTVDGGGSVFHLDQINNLVANNSLSDVSVSYDAGGSGSSGGLGCFDPCDPFGHSSSGGGGGFSMSADAHGAYATSSNPGSVGADASGSVGGAVTGASIVQDAFTQNIVMGANIQYNTMNLGVIGHDGGGATMDHVGA